MIHLLIVLALVGVYQIGKWIHDFYTWLDEHQKRRTLGDLVSQAKLHELKSGGRKR